MRAVQRRPARRSPSLPRPGLLLRRRPRLSWLVTALVAGGAAVGVGSVVASAEATRSAWGRTRTVAVATRDLEPGTALDDGDVDLVARPLAALPADALGSLPDGAILRHAVFAGEELLAAHLAPAGQRGLAAELDERHRAVAIPVEPGLTPPLEEGQLVDIVVVLPEASFDADAASVVAPRAEVLHVSDDAVTVSVRVADAPRIVAALATGLVTVTLVGAS